VICGYEDVNRVSSANPFGLQILPVGVAFGLIVALQGEITRPLVGLCSIEVEDPLGVEVLDLG
jgi:hypothetical protein